MLAVDIFSYGIGLAAALAVVIFAGRSPFRAFVIFIAALPLESSLALRGPLTISPVYVALLFVLAVGVLFPKAARGSFASPLNRVVMLYLVVAVLSMVMTIAIPPPTIPGSESLGWRVSQFRTVVQIGFLAFSVAAYFAAVFFCNTPERLRLATRVFIVTSGFVALYGLYQMVGVRYHMPLVGLYAQGLYEQPASLRPNSTLHEPMIFGHYLMVALALLVSGFLQRHALPADDRRWFGLRALPMLLVIALALFLTISRSAWMGAIVAIVAIMGLADRRGRRTALIMIGIAAVVVPILFAISVGSFEAAWHTVANRFDTSTRGLASEQRLWYQPFLLDLAAQHPMLGVGFGNYPLHQLARFSSYGIAGAYGVIWQSLVETGLVGLLTLVALMVGALRVLYRAMATRENPWRPYLVGWFGALMGLYVGFFFFGDRIALYVWAAFGLAMATVKVSDAYLRSNLKQEKPDVLILSSQDWTDVWTRKQRQAQRLARQGHRVLYVELQASWASLTILRVDWRRAFRWLQGPRRIEPNLFVATLPLALPAFQMSLAINRLNSWSMAGVLRGWLARLGFLRPVLWTYNPYSDGIIGRLGEAAAVYECVDEFSASHGLVRADVVRVLEDRVLQSVDAVIVTHPNLLASKSRLAKSITLIPNAADVEHFAQAQAPATEIPADVAALPRPIIGVVGTLQYWIDFQLLREIAQARPQWSLVLVGPRGRLGQVDLVEGLPNVHVLGRRPYDTVPAYVKAFDVCLNPYVLDGTAENCSPLKLYEYVASGKPVVSVDMPEARQFGDAVLIGRGLDDMIAKIEQALAPSMNTPAAVSARMDAALPHSWASRLQNMEAVLWQVWRQAEARDVSTSTVPAAAARQE